MPAKKLPSKEIAKAKDLHDNIMASNGSVVELDDPVPQADQVEQDFTVKQRFKFRVRLMTPLGQELNKYNKPYYWAHARIEAKDETLNRRPIKIGSKDKVLHEKFRAFDLILVEVDKDPRDLKEYDWLWINHRNLISIEERAKIQTTLFE